MALDRDAARDDETVEEQLTRNWNELLQELRVTQTGVQILTGFLLTVPFTDRFQDLAQHQVVIYLTVLAGAVLTTCSIVAPVAFHRVLFRQRQRPWLVKASHISARVGLASLAVVSSGVILLVFDVVVSTLAGVIASVAVLVVFFSVWLAVPVVGADKKDRGPT
jgi:NAD/NADP transhydrogenase beta subunit